MIEFLLNTWWIYIPIIAVLLFMTAVTNRKIEQATRAKQLRSMTPEERHKALQGDLKRKPGKLERLASKYGLRGIYSYIFPKK